MTTMDIDKTIFDLPSSWPIKRIELQNIMQ